MMKIAKQIEKDIFEVPKPKSPQNPEVTHLTVINLKEEYLRIGLEHGLTPTGFLL